jgi:lipocalin
LEEALLTSALKDGGVRYFNKEYSGGLTFFKDLRDSGRFTDQKHSENLKFCFMNIIQTHLDRIAQQWNVHEIRPQHNSNAHYGKPDIMYFYLKRLARLIMVRWLTNVM